MPDNDARRTLVAIGGAQLEGMLALPRPAKGLVIFAHGAGSSRLSPRNVFVAERLQRRGLGTFLFDLLTPAEAEERANVFDVPLLAARAGEAIRWARAWPETRGLPVGLFGASTGAAAALVAAADAPDMVGAVVARGGRPDLAGEALAAVRAPTLLIVGGADTAVLALNREALARLTSEKRLEVVPDATHLFEEPGALDAVVALAGTWFTTHLALGASGRP